MNEPIIVSRLNKHYDNIQVLKDFSYEFPPGTITYIMGRSGCGKTTLLSILMGLISPDSGTITGVLGKRKSAVFQENRLVDNLTVYKNISLLPRKNISKENITELFSQLGLENCIYKQVKELSGGMKRRVAIARALLAESDILFFDEPLNGLDIDTRRNVLRVIEEYTKGKTVLWITHDKRDIKLEDGAEILELI